MKNKKIVRILMAASCFTFASVKVFELMSGSLQNRGRDLIVLALFLMLGSLYVYLFWRDRNSPGS
ncbi:hypothetical protein ACSX1A_12380 [Pontibacter sp. MBLB2868]|uniref:hypothetical protein n=1 Tax=Pontibacter sp. MBLB2868 TaxID=3451555 RepID=UPI003F74F105